MPYITNHPLYLDEKEILLVPGLCDFCGTTILVPWDRSQETAFCSESHFRARYGAHCSEI